MFQRKKALAAIIEISCLENRELTTFWGSAVKEREESFLKFL